MTLVNETGMPIEFKTLSAENRVQTNGTVAEDLGKDNLVEYVKLKK